jgi:hypothetical protein
MNNRHRLARKLEQRRFMNDAKKLSKYVPSPTFAALCGMYDKRTIFMASYLAVQDALAKYQRRVINEFSER